MSPTEPTPFDDDAPFSLPHASIRLRPIGENDVDAIMTWINDPEITRNFAAFSEPISREQELAFIRRMRASRLDRLFAIERVGEDGPLIGTAGLHQIYWPARNGRLGLMIGRRTEQGRGLGQEALRLLVAYGFSRLGLHKLWLVHYADNGRMRHIAGKLGFQQEGVLRDEYFHAERWHDMVRHAILEPEWRAARLGSAADAG